MKLFFTWLRYRRGEIGLFFLCCGIFLLSFVLYRLPLEAVGYPALLCALLGAGALLWDFLRARRKHRRMEELQTWAAAMIQNLPAPDSLGEADLQALWENLRREMEAAEAAAESRYQEDMEYYTLWTHQIKTPITAMRLSLEGEDTPLSRKLSSELFQIEGYVEMALAYSRLDADSHDYVFREVPLDGILEQALAKFAPEFIHRRLRLDYRPTGALVVTDEKWLSFVVEQLLSNALKYTRTGEIRIYMEPPRRLCIADTGIGIGAADLPRVFEKGYTGCNGRRDKRASGIGLYLCKRICQALGAEIRIDSTLGKGTTVVIDLAQYPLSKA